MNYRQDTSISFDTLGCAKNSVDTDKMLRTLKCAGYCIVNNLEDADVIIVNTCAFIEAAAQESINTFFEYKNYYPEAKIVVAGCLVSRFPDLAQSMPEADLFVPCKNEKQIVEMIDNLTNSVPNATRINTRKNRYIKHQTSYAYVKISDGCNRHCAYCTIPSIRGKYVSSSYSSIYRDIDRANTSTIKEIVLVAQDCGVWGKDAGKNRNLAWLLRSLCADFPELNFRLLYIQPDAIDDELLEVFADNNNLINYFDIPLQHCNEKILKSMNRKGNTESFLSLIKSIRNRFEDCIIRTTLIVGFPGETNEDFDELYSFVDKARFDFLGVFEYSAEEGTKAFDMDNQIDNETKNERANIIRDLADRISIEKIDSLIGHQTEIIIEGQEDGRMFGRAWFQAPEVDGVVFIDNNKEYEIGQEIMVEITDTELYDLVAREI